MGLFDRSLWDKRGNGEGEGGRGKGKGRGGKCVIKAKPRGGGRKEILYCTRRR